MRRVSSVQLGRVNCRIVRRRRGPSTTVELTLPGLLAGGPVAATRSTDECLPQFPKSNVQSSLRTRPGHGPSLRMSRMDLMSVHKPVDGFYGESWICLSGSLLSNRLVWFSAWPTRREKDHFLPTIVMCSVRKEFLPHDTRHLPSAAVRQGVHE